MDAPACHSAGFAQGLEKEAPVRLVVKDGFAPIASRHDVVKGPAILNADAARHVFFSAKNGLLSRFDA
jgi:hypothetical protein